MGLGDAASVPWLLVPGVALGGDVEQAARMAHASSSVATALPRPLTAGRNSQAGAREGLCKQKAPGLSWDGGSSTPRNPS